MKIYDDNLISLYKDDAFNFMDMLKKESVDVIITDPPYFISNNGVTNSGGKFVSVNKGKWDQLHGEKMEDFYSRMLQCFSRILKPNGTIWIFGNMNNIYTIGYLLGKYDFKVLNNVTWQKSNPAPNLSRKMFTHSTENIIWAKKNNGKQFFNYDLMREINHHKQMKDVWTTSTLNKSERRYGKHPTQKPLSLLLRMIKASTKHGMLVLDPFVGSGTTLVASKIYGIKGIGVDSSEEYLKIAKRRLDDYVNERIGKIQ